MHQKDFPNGDPFLLHLHGIESKAVLRYTEISPAILVLKRMTRHLERMRKGQECFR